MSSGGARRWSPDRRLSRRHPDPMGASRPADLGYPGARPDRDPLGRSPGRRAEEGRLSDQVEHRRRDHGLRGHRRSRQPDGGLARRIRRPAWPVASRRSVRSARSSSRAGPVTPAATTSSAPPASPPRSPPTASASPASSPGPSSSLARPPRRSCSAKPS